MVFSSLFFLYFFLPLFLICYYAASKTTARNIVLVIFSLIFYAWGEPVYIILLILSTAVNFVLGKAAYSLVDSEKEKRAGILLAISLVLNIGTLLVFKYSGFIVENLNLLFRSQIPVPQIRLPIGISFYTFQTMSYVIDCYWQKIKPQKNYIWFLMYISCFPQLVAGPIVRYSTIESEITQRKISSTDISEGFSRLAIGLGKKVILADNLSTIVDSFLGSSLASFENTSILGTWYGVILYSMQIYFDFSGYSDMAIGMGRMMGFHFDENFKHPFLCKDVTDFWNRWHISLSTFFRDYLLYVPIFGKRRKYGGLFLVWFCTGLWHGASWNYIIWGLYYGIFIFIEELIGRKRVKKIPIIIRHIYNKLVIIVGFGIFYFESLNKLGVFFKNIVGANGNALYDTQLEISLMNNIFLIIVAIICCFPIVDGFKKLETYTHFGARVVYHSIATVIYIAIILVSSVFLVNATNHPFLYFRF